MARLDEYLRDIEECRIPELRVQLEPLETGNMRVGMRKGDGPWIDTTERTILRLRRTIVEYEAIAAKLRGGKPI